MPSKRNLLPAAAELRRRAETRLREQHKTQRSEVRERRSEADTQRLLHELQVHQIKLEMQNEELSRANARAEALAEKFSDLYDFAPLGYLSLDERGRIQELNFTAAKPLGKTRAELAGTPFVGYVTGRDRDICRQRMQTCSETRDNATWEVGLLSSEGGRILPVQLCTVFHRNESGQPPHYRMAISDITERKRAEEEVRQLNAELEARVQQRTATIRTLAVELTLAEQREKSRLAQVLHDHLQQMLVGAQYLLEIARQDSTRRTRRALAKVNEALIQSVAIVRTLSVELSPPVLQEEGLAAAVQWLGGWMREKHGLAVVVTSGPNPTPLSEELSVLVYQALRELLLNVVKQAEVKSARVTLDWLDAHVRFVVSDQGKGFDPARLETAGPSLSKFGLFAMRERLALLDGQMEVESAPGRGSRFTLRVPLHMPAVLSAKGKTKGVS